MMRTQHYCIFLDVFYYVYTQYRGEHNPQNKQYYLVQKIVLYMNYLHELVYTMKYHQSCF
jgi:hypothetical protein